MRIQFLGGAQTVTGAAYLVDNGRSRVLTDCGMFQGSRSLEERNRQIHLYRPRGIDAVVLTHAHIDHSGLLPALVKAGYRGPIFSTAATRDLCEILLLDSAHIQEMEAEWQTRKFLRGGRKRAVEPLYTQQDAREALELFVSIPYGERREVADGVHVRFQEAGHILGSASVEMWGTQGDQTIKIVFSGDLGRKEQPIIPNPQPIEEAELLLLESTYGDRLHKSQEDTLQEFLSIIREAIRDGQKVIVPAFAVGRSQEILYILHRLHRKGLLPEIPVYVDSPLAIAATEIFRRHPECFDGETRAILRQGDEPLGLPGLILSRTTEESRAINEAEGPSIVIAASGMCNAGRIRHHLKHNLWRPKVHVVFIGYQAEGTTGRQIVDGAKKVRLFGEEVAVRARIHTLGGFSAHADRDEILDWVGHFRTPGLRIFLIHGEEKVALALSRHLRERGFKQVEIPGPMETVDLLAPPLPAEAAAAEAQDASERMAELERRIRRLRKRMVRLGRPLEALEPALNAKAEEMEIVLEEMRALLDSGALDVK
jgi:metallo-beta-lactamase family protein